MKTKRICLTLLSAVTLNACKKVDNPKDIEAVKKVIINDGEARQNHDYELIKKCWANESYIVHFWATKYNCSLDRGWDKIDAAYRQPREYGFNKTTNVVRDNINVHVNGNGAFADFDLHLYDTEDTVEAKANAALEKINGEWKMVHLNVIDESSIKNVDDGWPF